ncbi:hypothetical protein QMK33_01960 [Hymenobacter sp. H14-R3]|uniref:hypothetical protein n=1 Tax=Hymenobacter sp. H14-R3 TaxID=3046308 RepID=UPI0024B9765B|nr:hypothetical protein [Hymenobacter sp. H14-R3]MDJ0363901.1 hypothetical protein [Hymenobacter sp. H14-R3]
MTLEEFERRVSFNGGHDRALGKWKILDVHHIPEIFQKQHEVDFYCSDGKSVYLLRIRQRAVEAYVKITGEIIYLIAELPFDVLDDKVIEKALAKFE